MNKHRGVLAWPVLLSFINISPLDKECQVLAFPITTLATFFSTPKVRTQSFKPASTASTLGEHFGLMGDMFDQNLLDFVAFKRINCEFHISNSAQCKKIIKGEIFLSIWSNKFI